MTPPPRRIGFIGLGAMGAPMAQRLSDAGTLTVFDVDSARCSDVAREIGAASAERLSDLAASDVVFIMVVTGQQAEEVLFGPDGIAERLRPGAIVIVLSTIGPQWAARLSQRLRSRGLRWVDAPVSGGVARAGSGDLLVMVGAEADVLAEVADLFDRLGSHVIHASDQSDGGQKLKAVNQLLCGVHIAVAAEALAFAEALGLDREATLHALETGAAASFMLSDRGPRMLEQDPEVRSAVALFDKDLGLVVAEAERVGIPTPIARIAHAQFAEGVRRGWARRDDSQIIDLYTADDSRSPEARNRS